MKPLPSLKWLVRLGTIYGLTAVAWSLAGFFSPVSPLGLHEYSVSSFAVEIGGHMLWGLIAALPTLDPALILLVVGESVLIDADHILSVAGLPVEPRLAHSFTFALFIAFTLAYVGKRGATFDRGIFWSTLGAIAGHFSYDIFAGYGLFPIFAPFYNTYIALPFYAWPLLEGLALVLCLLTWFPKRGRQAPAPPAGQLSRSRAASGGRGRPLRRYVVSVTLQARKRRRGPAEPSPGPLRR